MNGDKEFVDDYSHFVFLSACIKGKKLVEMNIVQIFFKIVQ